MNMYCEECCSAIDECCGSCTHNTDEIIETNCSCQKCEVKNTCPSAYNCIECCYIDCDFAIDE